jgi:hypothetical protein
MNREVILVAQSQGVDLARFTTMLASLLELASLVDSIYAKRHKMEMFFSWTECLCCSKYRETIYIPHTLVEIFCSMRPKMKMVDVTCAVNLWFELK